ncbi:MAG: TolC family outer membrane protein [Betaproteobacteria bacterium]|nr:TolC family outer membrane protein [Betaproteobacteria bacterium]
MPLRPTLLTAALLLALPPAWGANLGGLYQQALEQDAQYAAARETYKAGLEKLPQAQAAQRPTVQVSGNARLANSRTEISGAATTLNYQPHGFTLSLSQSLYNQQNIENVEIGKLQVALAEQQLKLAEQELLLRVAKAYFETLQAQDALETANAQKQAIGEQLALAKKSFEVGNATITDAHEAQARYDLTEAQEIAARNDLDVKRRALEKIINQETPRLALLADAIQAPLPQPNDMNAWVRQAEAGSLSVSLAQSALEVSRRQVQVQRAGNKPTLSLGASYSDNRDQAQSTIKGVDSRSALIGVELAWTPYQGGVVDSRVKEAIANQEKARFDLDHARRQAVLDARQGFLGVLSGDARIKALDQALISSEAQLKSTKLGLEVGVRTRVDVLNAQQQVFSTKRDLAAARYQTLISGLQLKAAAGSVGEADLKAIDQLLREP